jgi:hypothetical protein
MEKESQNQTHSPDMQHQRKAYGFSLESHLQVSPTVAELGLFQLDYEHNHVAEQKTLLGQPILQRENR